VKNANVSQKETTHGAFSHTQTPPLPHPAKTRTLLLDLDEFRAHLATFAKASGGNAELGRRLGLTGQFIDYLISGERKPGKKALAALGARRRVMIEIDVEGE